MQLCRICNSETEIVFDLGEIYPSDFIALDEKSEEVSQKFPLTLVKCKNCGLVQLNGNIQMDDMYKQYWYRSGLNKSMVSDLKDVVEDTLMRLKCYSKEDVWLDIGCNDCTLFNFVPRNFIKIGVDPCVNIEPSGDFNIFINDYFSAEDYDHKKATVITSIAMFYDLPNPNKFVEDIASILCDDGIWVAQFTDLQSMLALKAFDNVCHEHLEYYTLQDIEKLVEKFGLQVFDVEYVNVNGRSLRVYVCKKGAYPVTTSSQVYSHLESTFLNSESGDFKIFKEKIDEQRDCLVSLLKEFKEKDKQVFILGASTKGNTLLQYYGIDNKLVSFAAEINQDKFGLKTIGSEIPIISEKDAMKLKPDYFLVLPWHFRENLIHTFNKYIESGGGLIFPLPRVSIETKKGTINF